MGKMVGITEFKAKCIALLDEMERTGEPLTVTRRGKPTLMLTARAAREPTDAGLFGCMKGTVIYHQDYDPGEPLDPDWEEKWLAKWDEKLRDPT